MKRILPVILCIFMSVLMCACSNTASTDTPTEETVSAATVQNGAGDEIVGTWICEEINDDCYFIFDSNGDAYAKWGTSTVYGYYDYDSESGLYDIDVPNFLYNEYEGHFGGDVMTLKSETSSFTFEKAEMPQITIKASENLKVDKKILGDWQSADNYECYRFNDDSTAVITDLYNYATIDAKYTCKDGVITIYYMSSATKDGFREIEYSFNGEKLVLDGYEYEAVQSNM